MIELSERIIEMALPRIKNGLERYCWIQDHVGKCDVSQDRLFQTRFNAFYKVRCNAAWRSQFYTLMQDAKGRGTSFAEALRQMREKTGRIETSFTSKLVATLNPDKPVIDRFVLRNVGLRLPYHSSRDREEKSIAVYRQLCHFYEDYLGATAARIICEKFNQAYPQAQITDLKKVDLVLWQTRE